MTTLSSTGSASGRLGGVDDRLRARLDRDVVIDLLALGETYPLAEVPIGFPVVDRDGVETVLDRTQVAYAQGVEVVVPTGQPDVTYSLCDLDGMPVDDHGVEVSLVGGCTRTVFHLSRLTTDLSVRVRARKDVTGRTALVGPVLTARVGVATDLDVATSLDDGPFTTVTGSPLVVDFAGAVRVEVGPTQAGMDYELLSVKGGQTWRILTEQERGHEGRPVVLDSGPLERDTTLRVRAVRASDRKVAGLIDTAVAVWVRPDPAVAWSMRPATPVPPGTVVVAEVPARAGDEIVAYAHPVSDQEWVRAADGGVTVDVTGAGRAWANPEGFEAAADPMRLTATTDLAVVVRASTVHTLGGAGATAVQLAVSGLVLVEPLRDPDLLLVWRDDPQGATLLFEGGQPGVFYAVADPEVDGLTDPVYVHRARRAPNGGSVDVGVDDLRLGVDLALTDGGGSPYVDASGLSRPARLTLNARMAQTGVVVPLDRTAELVVPPVVTPVEVPAGTGATVEVADLSPGWTAELVVLDRKVPGTPGADGSVSLLGPPLTASVRGVVRLTPAASDSLPVRYDVPVLLSVSSPKAAPETGPQTDPDPTVDLVVEPSTDPTDLEAPG